MIKKLIDTFKYVLNKNNIDFISKLKAFQRITN